MLAPVICVSICSLTKKHSFQKCSIKCTESLLTEKKKKSDSHQPIYNHTAAAILQREDCSFNWCPLKHATQTFPPEQVGRSRSLHLSAETNRCKILSLVLCPISLAALTRSLCAMPLLGKKKGDAAGYEDYHCCVADSVLT